MNELKAFDISYLNKEVKVITGVDEAGRGPLAGPVVAAAVVFRNDIFIEGVNDSKKISEKERDRLAKLIIEKAEGYAYGVVNQKIIDDINILQASLKAMKIAVSKLKIASDLILIDGNKSFTSKTQTQTIVKGDGKSFSIAAASILAKVKRDKIMLKESKKYQNYGWETNKGYGTKKHIEAIKKYGCTELHRQTFLKKILNREIQEELL